MSTIFRQYFGHSRALSMGRGGFNKSCTPAAWAQASAFDRIKMALSHVEPDDPRFTAPLFHGGLRLRSAEKPSSTTCTATFEVTNGEYWSNSSGNMHGGAQAAIYDICTSLVLAGIAEEGFWMHAGVSRTLGVSYLKPAVTGEDVLVECEVVSAGKRMVYIRGCMRRALDEVLLSTCEHHKVSIEPGKSSKL